MTRALDLDGLEALAKEASQGEWTVVEGCCDGLFDVEVQADEDGNAAENCFSNDAAFIAAANPETVQLLIAAARERDGLREALAEIVDIAALEDVNDNISRDDFSRGVRAARLDVGRIARHALTNKADGEESGYA